MKSKARHKLPSLALVMAMAVSLFPTAAFAYTLIHIQPGELTPSTISGYDYTFTVGDTINLRFYGAGAVYAPQGPPSYTGVLPSGVSITNFDGTSPFFSVGGTCTNATSGAASATLSFTRMDGVTATRDITITVDKATPTISGTSALSGAAGFMGQQKATATIAGGYLGGTTPSMALTATITDGTNTATATASSASADVSFDFPASQLNTLAVGGPYDIMGAFAGNANNETFGATKIGEFTIAAPTYGITVNPPGNKTFTSATVGYGAQTPYSVVVSNNGTGDAGALAVALGGTNPGDFELSKTALAVALGTSDGFTVAPKTGLAVGTHTATVSITESNGIAQRFDVSFTVRPQSSPTPNISPGSSDTRPPSPLPKMGDGFPMGALLALLCIFLTAFIWLGLRRRSKKTPS